MSETPSTVVWIVIPCYNEETRLPREEFLRFAAEANGAVRFLWVDDGSSDGTAAVLEELAAQTGGKALRLPKNHGKAEAVRRGILSLRAEPECRAVGFWDADLAAPLEFILPMASILCDRHLAAVIGSRWSHLGECRIKRRWQRHVIGRIFAFSVAQLLDSPVYDTQCGAKLFAPETAEKLFARPFVTRWFFDVELLRRLQVLKGTCDLSHLVWEVPLRDWHDVPTSKVNMLRAFGDFILLLTHWRKIRP